MKRVLYFVIGLALVGFGTYKYSKFRVDQANAQRYDKIYSSSRFTNPSKTKFIALWQFALGPVVEAKSLTVSDTHHFRENDLPEFYRHLRDRITYFRNLRGDSHENLDTTLSCNFQGKTNRIVYYAQVGMEVIPLQTGTKQKYKVINIESAGCFVVSELGQPIRLPGQRQIVKRSDFVNPEDIDWMFDVKDFSKINAYATIVP